MMHSFLISLIFDACLNHLSESIASRFASDAQFRLGREFLELHACEYGKLYVMRNGFVSNPKYYGYWKAHDNCVAIEFSGEQSAIIDGVELRWGSHSEWVFVEYDVTSVVWK